MRLEEIFEPISKELSLVEDEIKGIVSDLVVHSAQEVLQQFFKMPGKYLRPALVMLSYSMIKGEKDATVDYKLIQLGMCMELIHNASLIHDDIIDGDATRRGQKTLNNVFGNKIAVLAGDTLYTRVFLIMANTFPREFLQLTAHMAERMCIAEIDQARFDEGASDIERYLSVIRDKTAFFMSICCRLGARLAGANDEEAGKLGDFGMNFGLAYQVVDDCMDEDPIASRFVGPQDAEKFAAKAIDSLKDFNDSIYKEKLVDLVSFVMSYSHA